MRAAGRRAGLGGMYRRAHRHLSPLLARLQTSSNRRRWLRPVSCCSVLPDSDVAPPDMASVQGGPLEDPRVAGCLHATQRPAQAAASWQVLAITARSRRACAMSLSTCERPRACAQCIWGVPACSRRQNQPELEASGGYAEYIQ
ncbi:hypothetical protein K474DRAFT_1660314 [Panus rudis PR-1116 ss-1]|nr:hypothetical protein K474DRAFT_1660314 [Panus rudis PR-1116 ss-1]